MREGTPFLPDMHLTTKAQWREADGTGRILPQKGGKLLGRTQHPPRVSGQVPLGEAKIRGCSAAVPCEAPSLSLCCSHHTRQSWPMRWRGCASLRAPGTCSCTHGWILFCAPYRHAERCSMKHGHRAENVEYSGTVTINLQLNFSFS